MKQCQKCGRQVRHLVITSYQREIGPGAFACCRSELCEDCTAEAEKQRHAQGLKGTMWAPKQEATK